MNVLAAAQHLPIQKKDVQRRSACGDLLDFHSFIEQGEVVPGLKVIIHASHQGGQRHIISVPQAQLSIEVRARRINMPALRKKITLPASRRDLRHHLVVDGSVADRVGFVIIIWRIDHDLGWAKHIAALDP